jgi:hypothetical protein
MSTQTVSAFVAFLRTLCSPDLLATFLRENVRPDKTLNEFSRRRLIALVETFFHYLDTPLSRYTVTGNGSVMRTRVDRITRASKNLTSLNQILNQLNFILIPESPRVLYKFPPIPIDIPSWNAYMETELAPLARTSPRPNADGKEREVKSGRRVINLDYLDDPVDRRLNLDSKTVYEHENPIAFLAWMKAMQGRITLGRVDRLGLIRVGPQTELYPENNQFSFFLGTHDIVQMIEFVLKSHGNYRINNHRTDKGRGVQFPVDTSGLCQYDEAIRDIGNLITDLYIALVPSGLAICKCRQCLNTNPFHAKLFYVPNQSPDVRAYIRCRHGNQFCNMCGAGQYAHGSGGTCPDSDQLQILSALSGKAYRCPGPGCTNIIDKRNDGSCNHMTCDRPTCGAHSCNVCHKLLHPTNGEISEHFMFGPNRCPQYNRR